MTITVYIATHKHYAMPNEAPYLPIHAGKSLAQQDLGYTGDDTGENISFKNRTYCELTALYWIAKNSPADYVGLMHYRRYFAGSGWRGVATGDEIKSLLEGADILVPKPRNYIIETVRTHYARAHYEDDLDIARRVIANMHPTYITSFDELMRSRRLSLYNMFIMPTNVLRDYAGWLFPILAEVEAVVPVDKYGPQQARVFGYLGERLFNVWFMRNRTSLRIRYVPIRSLEGEPIFRKGIGLLMRRFGRGRAN